ncbi:hypothetical protein HDU97_008358 [Phlyctochytrium planicorne]|nr:hypothetical protein HDU97_008358 [Phlyctochytrium planicorne]
MRPNTVIPLLLAIFVQSLTAQVVKPNVAKIGLSLPFGIPGYPIQVWSTLSAFSVQTYNPIAWYLEWLNNQTDILPNLRLELASTNTMYDRGMTLTVAQALSSQGAIAVIGEVVSRNTVTAALVASISKMFHCSPHSTATALSNKGDYPYTYRTTPTNARESAETRFEEILTTGKLFAEYSAAIIALIKSQNITNFGILASDDEVGVLQQRNEIGRGGQSYVQELTARAKANNITVRGFVSYTLGKQYYFDELKTILATKTQTIIVMAALTDGARIMVTANNMTLLNGDYWFIGTNGFGPGTYATPEEIQTLSNMTGFYQVVGRRGKNGLWMDFEKHWFSNFNSDGTMVINSTGSYCDMTVPFARGCHGKGPGIVGAMPEWIKAGKYTFPTDPDYWFTFCFACIDMIARTLDFYLKNGTITVADIISKKALTVAAAGNITNFFNAPQMSDYWGKTFKLDRNGDLLSDIGINNYKYDANKKSVWFAEVGVWDQSTDVVVPTGDFVFMGSKTSAPQPPPTPTNQYQAKLPLRYAFDGIVAFCSAISIALGCAMVFYIKQRIFKASSPIFLALILLGANISFISIWLFSQYPMTSSSCITYGWLKYIGFAVVFGSLIVKTYRIFVIFTTKKKGKQNLSDSVLMGYFLVLLAIWVVILLVWTIVPSQRPFLDAEVRYKLDDHGMVASVEVTPFCNFTSYNYVCLAAMVLTLVYGVFLTYSVRNTPGAFNESKWIAYAIYNWVVIGIVLNAIANFAVSNPDIIFVMEALVVIITQTGVCAFMIAPKLYVISQGNGDEVETFQSSGTSSTNSKATKGATSSINNANNEKEIDTLKAKLLTAEGELSRSKKEANDYRTKYEALEKELAALSEQK